MGDPTARYIEEKLTLETGWMDTPPSYQDNLEQDDPRSKILLLMEALPESEWNTAIRLLAALGKPDEEQKNGTEH